MALRLVPAVPFTGNSAPNPLKAPRLRSNHRIHTDDLAMQIQQGATTIARIDRRISLEKILIATQIRDATPVLGTDESVGDCLIQIAPH